MSANKTVLDEKALLIRAIESREGEYDAQVGMLRRAFESPGYHTTLTAEEYPTTHPTYPSLHYAVALLNSEAPEYEQRAYAILDSVLALQDRDPQSDTYGIWPWFYEEPLARMAPPDWNWADFCGKELVTVASRHGHKLPEALKDRVREAISCACDAIIRRNVGPHYTNIAMMGSFVTLIAGELYGRQDYAEYGLERLEKLQRYTAKLGAFQEFNSPSYSIIAIVELSKIRRYTASSRARAIADGLLDMAWKMVAEHYHPRSREWAGPHSRSYSTLLKNNAKSFLQMGTGNKLAFFTPEELVYDPEWYDVGIRCPDRYMELFEREEERTLKQLYYRNEETGFVKWAQTHLTPRYAVGLFGHEIMWNQTRGMVAYFDNGGLPTYLHMRCLHDGYDYCSAVLTTAWHEGHLLLGVSFLTDGGDTHPNLDRIQGAIDASDFRLRMEFGGSLDGVDFEQAGSVTHVLIDGLPLRFESIYAAFEGEGAPSPSCGHRSSSPGTAGWGWEVTRQQERVGLDLVIYAGERERIDFKALDKAAFLFSVVMGGEPAKKPLLLSAREEEGLVTVRAADTGAKEEGAHLSVSLKPSDKHPN